MSISLIRPVGRLWVVRGDAEHTLAGGERLSLAGLGASPLADSVDVARRLEDAGASAIVMRSLFEEQIDAEQLALRHHVEFGAESNPEGTSYFPAFGTESR